MSKKNIPYHKTGYFSALICDYLSRDDKTEAFYNRFPSLEAFKGQIQEKHAFFSKEKRMVLVTQLKQQYDHCETSQKVHEHIDLLSNEKTFTITTGHQLNLFTGPLYFLYKIFSVINLCESLQKKYPSYNFVPIYWMASEDHDFEEIQYFNFNGKKVVWNRDASGPVGELSTEGLDKVKEILKKEFGQSEYAQYLLNLFEESYLKHNNLTDATRYLANALFETYGLVIVDGNDAKLKEAFASYALQELTQQRSHNYVSKTTSELEEIGYNKQVHPREINLFYMKEGLRERIIKKGAHYFVQDTAFQFTQEEIQKELETHPERFSPNALLRPLYQEVILPNLCYIGGGGELAYWFQLKEYFNAVSVPFPILLLRNSVLLLPTKLSEKLDKLEVPLERLFHKKHELRSWYTRKLSEIEIDFTPQRNHLKQQFKDLYELAKQTDASFEGAVAAQEKKQLNGLDHLEKRLLKAQKRKLADHLERLDLLQMELFPNESLQERQHNFSQWYMEIGPSLFSKLKENLDPLSMEFCVLEV